MAGKCSKEHCDKGHGHELSFTDERFGCPVNGRRPRTPRFKIRHGMKGDMRDYREDLARFPNDPEAYVDGPRAVQKLWDKRQRQGWTRREITSNPKPKSPEQVAREAYERAKANGFRMQEEIDAAGG